MRIKRVVVRGKERRYFLFTHRKFEKLVFVETPLSKKLGSMSSSDIFFEESTGGIAKVKKDKYDRKKDKLKWLFRDYLEKRVLFQFDARKEARSKKIIEKSGLKTPCCIAYGYSLNPFNENGSLLLVKYVENAKTGGDFFQALCSSDKYKFLERLARNLSLLINAGYMHRDLHMSNFLCDELGDFIWIDTHVKALPKNKGAKFKSIKSSFDSIDILSKEHKVFLLNEVIKKGKV